MRRGFVILAWLVLLQTVAGAEFEVVSLEGREYVTLASVAAFYGMGAPTSPAPKKFTASGNGRSIEIEVNTRDAMINGVRHWLSFNALLAPAGPCISRVDLSRTVDPALRPEKVTARRTIRTVVLDAGHGGHDRGALSMFGTEKEFALDVVRRLRKKLEAAGLRVVQTRNSDVFIDLEKRPRVANKSANAVFVSVHFNSADWRPAANGLETFCIAPLGAPPTGQDKVLARDRLKEKGHALEPLNFVFANTVHHALIARLKPEDRGVKRARFVVLKEASVPAILIEGGFLTNPAEASRIGLSSYREQLAGAIAAGILEFKKLAEQGVKPKERKDW